MTVTIRDIAKDLSISPATVSRSLRNDRLINSRTKAKVIKRAIEMGYHGSARPKKEADSNVLSISVLIPDSFNLFTKHSNFRNIFEGIYFEIDSVQANLSIHSVKWAERGSPASRNTIKETINPETSDVIILLGAHEPADIQFISQFAPLVTINHEYEGVSADSVNSDHSAGIRLVVEHLADMGHKRLQWVSEEYETAFFRERHASFIESCLYKELDIQMNSYSERPSIADEDAVLLEKLKAGIDAGVTAFVCPTDKVALGIVNLLERGGIDVPREVSVTGFDNWGMPSSRGKLLTSVDPAFIQLGRGAVRMACQRVNNPAMPKNKLYLPIEFVPGETSSVNNRK